MWQLTRVGSTLLRRQAVLSAESDVVVGDVEEPYVEPPDRDAPGDVAERGVDRFADAISPKGPPRCIEGARVEIDCRSHLM